MTQIREIGGLSPGGPSSMLHTAHKLASLVKKLSDTRKKNERKNN